MENSSTYDNNTDQTLQKSSTTLPEREDERHGKVKTMTLCACVSRNFIDKERIARLAAKASLNGWEVRIEPDLCELAADRGDEMKSIAEGVIVGCHERALKSIVESTGMTPGKLLNARENDAETLLNEIGILSPEESVKLEEYRSIIADMPGKYGEDAWYPVLDKDVCAECSKCLDYCPFGVYEMVDDRVRVMHPHNCKNNCPACARLCPANAVIFPKYSQSPINGGEAEEDEATQLDTKALYAKAFKERLEARRKKR